MSRLLQSPNPSSPQEDRRPAQKQKSMSEVARPAFPVGATEPSSARALIVSAFFGLVAGCLLAFLPPEIGLGLALIGVVCFLALVRPPAAFVAVAAALPFYHLATAEVVPRLRLSALELAGAVLLAGLMLPRRKPLAPSLKRLPFQFWLLVCLLAWAVASALMTPFSQKETLMATKPFMAVLVFWFLTFTFARRRKWFSLLVTALLVGTICAQGFGLTQAVTRARRGVRGVPLPEITEARGSKPLARRGVRVLGVTVDPNLYAYASVVTLPLCLAAFVASRRRRIPWAAAGAALAAALVTSYSRGALIAAVAALGWFVLHATRFRLLAISAVVLVVIAVAAAAPEMYVRRMKQLATGQLDRSVRQRWTYGVLAVQTAASHPLFGIGTGNFAKVNPRRQMVHNTYLEMGTELGWPALGAFLALLALTMRDLSRASGSLVRSGQTREALLVRAVESALVGTMVFWLFFSMFGHKTAWFLLSAAAASPVAFAAPRANRAPGLNRAA